jgi:hypothetical protein
MSEDSKHADNDFEPHFQTGATSVEHKNLDEAGTDHPLGSEPMSFEADLRHLIRKVADDLYESWEATIREYLANAETACLRVQHFKENPEESPLDDVIVGESYEPKIEVIWDKQEERLTIKDNGIGMAGAEVDEIFRKIGHSASRDYGKYSGQFGMGALSFVKFVGLDNSMTMLTHSRLNDDNFAADVSLAGLEGLRGSLDDDEYGTKFHMSPDGEYSVRQAVEQYAEWMRVPVLYVEYDESGVETFNEDWGNKSFTDEYAKDKVCLNVSESGAFEAYCAPDAKGRTLLLSMDIDRNDGSGSRRHGAPFDFDVRLLDESGVVFKGPHAGMMPCPRSDYEEMLIQARAGAITRDLLREDDVVGQLVSDGPNEGKMVVTPDALESPRLPAGYEFITGAELDDADEPGEAEVILGPHSGRTIVSEEEWDSLDEGRAERYVPEEELVPFDADTGEGDLKLPEPTSDRDRLQSHDVFWKWLGEQFEDEFKTKVDNVFDLIDGTDDPLQTILELEPENLVVTPSGN